MTTWQWLSFMLVAVAHTAVLFRWGGKIETLLNSSQREIGNLKKNDTKLFDFVNKHEAEIYLLKDKVDGLEEARNG